MDLETIKGYLESSKQEDVHLGIDHVRRLLKVNRLRDTQMIMDSVWLPLCQCLDSTLDTAMLFSSCMLIYTLLIKCPHVFNPQNNEHFWILMKSLIRTTLIHGRIRIRLITQSILIKLLQKINFNSSVVKCLVVFGLQSENQAVVVATCSFIIRYISPKSRIQSYNELISALLTLISHGKETKDITRKEMDQHYFIATLKHIQSIITLDDFKVIVNTMDKNLIDAYNTCEPRLEITYQRVIHHMMREQKQDELNFSSGQINQGTLQHTRSIKFKTTSLMKLDQQNHSDNEVDVTERASGDKKADDTIPKEMEYGVILKSSLVRHPVAIKKSRLPRLPWLIQSLKQYKASLITVLDQE
ncbi:hypothetical protein MP228_008415 [Amoeboaphelidium protococcarum]|nr:hypothetical protein MP228_008415 [Amoeboaphelidium protococcarum]